MNGNRQVIRPVKPKDACEISRIYNHYIENSVITFEEETVTSTEMKRRIDTIAQKLPWIVFEEKGILKGYAYAAPWRVRSAYRFSVESTVYLDNNSRGRGIGKTLYKGLLEDLETRGIHRVIGGIALPNDTSVRLHESLGFRKCALFTEVGYKMGRWIDVGYWEKELN